MIVTIIAGGSGTRLWPLSTNSYPKHLLKLTNERSLLQATYDRAKRMTDDIYVVTDASHAEHVKEQLNELPEDAFIIEPGRRGTANCIVAALDKVARVHDHDEPVVFLAADHHIRDDEGFAHTFSIATKTSKKQSKITLVGVEPTYPATGLGYIEKHAPLSDESNVYQVAAFKEKPQYDVAQQYVESGRYLWNCSYFVGSVATFLDVMKESAPQLNQSFETLQKINELGSEEYHQAYLSFENNTIDYALIEKVKDLQVVPATFDWMDVGSFKDLHQANERDEKDNHVRGGGVHLEDIENSYVRNEEDKPVAVIGLDNVVIVNTKNGVLVARKDLSQKVGDIAKKVQAEKEQ